MIQKIKIRFYPIVMIGALLLLNSCDKLDWIFKNHGNKKLPDLILDINGNLYHTVTIGTQVWLKENLKVTKYSNGDTIQHFENIKQWGNSMKTGAYCSYKNSSSNANIYGHLYNFASVIDNRNICPTGWHVPSYAEWQTLIDYLGGENVAGARLKETGITHWTNPNTDATNESGFTALPGGCLNYAEAFKNIGFNGYWWSSTIPHGKISNIEGGAPPGWGPPAGCAFPIPPSPTLGFYVLMLSYNNNKTLFTDEGGNLVGCSVRCLKNN